MLLSHASLCLSLSLSLSLSLCYRFASDNRIIEVKKLLTSSDAKTVSLNGQDDAEPEQVAALQARLMQYALRTCSLPVGRGAFTLGASAHPILTEPLPQPRLCFAGKIPSQHNAIVNLDTTSTVPSIVNLGGELQTWPKFHNGVASGLRLSRDGQTKLARTWVVYNRHAEPSYSHAGLLMALGLNGHLRVLATTDLYRYLGQCHDATTVGVLIGLAASKRKSLDAAVSKTLFLHIPTQHPSSYPELELSPQVQAAALMGVGLLYESSAHRLMTEILLEEIGRRPGSEVIRDREGYSLAAGLALGLVTLGKGSSALGLADLRLEDRLTHLFTGQGSPGGVGLGDNQHQQQTIYGGTGGGGSAARDANERQPEDANGMNRGHTMEGSLVNLDVTAPGAILALGLMYMKTNDKNVADRLAIPDTHFALDYVRPDFILLRLVARSLVMWDSIEPTEDFILGSLPAILRDFDPSLPRDGPVDRETGHDLEALAQGQVQGLAGACMSVGLKFAGSANPNAEAILTAYVKRFLQRKREVPQMATPATSASADYRTKLIDRSVLEMCLNTAVLSLAVVMAGTGHLRTLQLFRYLHRRLEPVGTGASGISYGNHMAINMAIGFLFMGAGTHTFGTSSSSIASLVIALYPRFPSSPNDNRCHLQAFRHIYALASEPRCLTTVDVDTGKPCFCPIEIELVDAQAMPSRSSLEASVHILKATAPCLVPEQHMIRAIRVGGQRYLRQRLGGTGCTSLPTSTSVDAPLHGGDPGGCEENSIECLAKIGWTVAVKRKIGSRPYEEDPTGNLSLLSRTFYNSSSSDSDGGSGKRSGARPHETNSSQFELLSAFSSDPNLLGFAQTFCSSPLASLLASPSSSPATSCKKFVEFCRSTLLECVVEEKPLMLYAHLELFCGVMCLIADVKYGGDDEFTNHIAWDLKLCAAYYDAATSAAAPHGRGESNSSFLLKPIFIKTMMQHVRDFALTKGYAQGVRDCAAVAESTPVPLPTKSGCDTESVLDDDSFGAFCVLNDLPWQLSLGVADVNTISKETCTEDVLLLKLGAL